VTDYLRKKWLHIRMYRSNNSFMFDYMLLRHFHKMARVSE